MQIETLTIVGGRGRDGKPEPVDKLTIGMGDILSIVGPTGCGKTNLLNDIELLADANTPSQRRILVNGRAPDEVAMPARNPVASITQHTNFLSDLPVRRFLEIHARIREAGRGDSVVEETLDFANQLTGEPISPAVAMTELSGGQTRSLLIADAVVIGNSPVILLDEIENAGIHRGRALELLKGHRKLFIFVTHDPRIILLSDYRVVMRNGAMQQVIATDSEERGVAAEITKMDDLLTGFRDRIRDGGRVRAADMESGLRGLGYLA